MTKHNITAVIFDYGEVLCHRPRKDEMERLAGVFGASMEAFPDLWMRNRHAFDRGDLTAEAYWNLMGEDTGRSVDEFQMKEVCQLDMEMWGRDNATIVEWMRTLRADGFKVGLLSNMHADMVAFVRKKFAWVEEFDFQVFSADVKMVKPNADIYEYTLRGLGVKSQESLFIDDRIGNIEAARALGMQAIQFTSVDQLRDDLRMMSFPILPETAPVSM